LSGTWKAVIVAAVVLVWFAVIAVGIIYLRRLHKGQR
jgi:hypothetical protein